MSNCPTRSPVDERHRLHRSKRVLRDPRRCGQEPKSKRTSPPSSLKRASNGLPDFDSKPLSTGLRPCFRSAWAVRAVIRLPAMVFQIANLHPRCQPLQP